MNTPGTETAARNGDRPLFIKTATSTPPRRGAKMIQTEVTRI